MKSHSLSTLVVGVMLIACAGCQSNTFTHQKFHERSPQLTKVVLLPPQIKTGVASNLCVVLQGPPLPEEAKMRAELPGLIATAFRQHGLALAGSVQPAQLTDATNQFWNTGLPDNFFAAYKTMSDLKTVQPEAIALANHLHADGLVCLNVYAFQSSSSRKGRVALNNFLVFILALGGGQPGYWTPTSAWTPCSEAVVQISLFDGKTGELLWRTLQDFTPFEQKPPAQVVAELFQNYPKR